MDVGNCYRGSPGPRHAHCNRSLPPRKLAGASSLRASSPPALSAPPIASTGPRGGSQISICQTVDCPARHGLAHFYGPVSPFRRMPHRLIRKLGERISLEFSAAEAARKVRSLPWDIPNAGPLLALISVVQCATLPRMASPSHRPAAGCPARSVSLGPAVGRCDGPVSRACQQLPRHC